MNLNEQVKAAATALQAADALLISAGAGLGVDSGLPDFRGREGFWRAYPVFAERGLSFGAVANPAVFREDPRLAWAFYGHRLNLYRQTPPHAGFHRLLEIGTAKPAGYFVFTSNVDGHFQKAGFAAERIVECHGSIHHFQCTTPCREAIWEATEETVILEENAFRARMPMPQCRYCSALARPNILMFGDWLWLEQRTAAQHKRFANWLTELARSAAKIVVIELGAGSAIPTVRSTSEQVVEVLGGRLIRINPRECEVPPGHIGLPCGALAGIQRISA
ncbi:MAG: NAD-dependent deacetylase [Verrucomicrobia bacterium]|nr:NAD-dependent deacetylase [Verrucomicrobiota bacterium]